jgi:predicted transcriptional regulator
MDIVWDHEYVTVPIVVSRLDRSLAYTTVMTTLKILEEKGIVERGAKRGRANTYRAKYSRHEVSQSMATALSDGIFRGSIKSLVLSLLNNNQIPAGDIEELKAAIERLERRDQSDAQGLT